MRPLFVKRFVLSPGARTSGKRKPANGRYAVVFFSNSLKRATKLARVLVAAGIRVHYAATPVEVQILLDVTSADVVLIDGRTLGECEQILCVLATDFPKASTVVLSPFDAKVSAQLYAVGACAIVAEPARFFDLLGALEWAHGMHRELTDAVRFQSRVDSIMTAIRRPADVGEADSPTRRGVKKANAGEAITVRVRRLGPVN